VKVQQARLVQRARLALADFPVDMAWSPDAAALVVAGGEGTLRWVDVATARLEGQPLGTHTGGVLALTWQTVGMLFASSGQDGEVRLWDARTRSARCIHSAAEWSEHLAFAPHGRLLAVATARRLQIYDAAGAEQALFPEHGGNIAALAWKPKSNDIAAVGNGGARVHRVLEPMQTHEFPWKGACLTACWSPDGRVLASGLQDGSVHFWYVAAGKQSEMKGYGAKVKLTTWSGNGRYLATGAAEQIIVWEFAARGPEGSEPLELRAHTGRLTQLAFQPQPIGVCCSGSRERRPSLWMQTCWVMRLCCCAGRATVSSWR
jgi:WD40 repeat protein